MPICNPLLKNCDNVTKPIEYTNNVLQSVISIFFIVGIIYFVWHFMMGAYHLISQEGDPKKIETAKHQFTNSFLGLGVMFTIFAILKFIGLVMGVEGLNTLKLTWPTL